MSAILRTKLIIVCVAICFALGFSLAPAWPFQGEFLTGKVINVHDGDTLTILDETGFKRRIRLYGIDAPELMQDGGQAAGDFLRNLALGQRVKVVSQDMDRYGRVVGEVMVEGEDESLNVQMVRNGYAWVYRSYCKALACVRLVSLEQQARQQSLGIWKPGGQQQPPWDWRKNHKTSRSTLDFQTFQVASAL